MLNHTPKCGVHGYSEEHGSACMGVAFACLLALTAFPTVREAAAQGIVETDRAALVALYNATDGANWRNNTNWLSPRPLGEWYGVTTDGAGTMTVRNRSFVQACPRMGSKN